MQTYKGAISSLGDYTELTTTVIHTDGGIARSGMFDQQKERFIDGLTIGGKTFGRMSCPPNLYPYFELGKEVELYTWVHPFLGIPPLRTGIIGIAYPAEKRAYVVGLGQTTLSLLLLALLPMLWVIPALMVGFILGSVLHLPTLLVLLIMVLVALAPWIAGGLMVWSIVKLRAAYPAAVTPK